MGVRGGGGERVGVCRPIRSLQHDRGVRGAGVRGGRGEGAVMRRGGG